VNLSTRIMTISTLVATAALALGYGLNRQPIGVLVFIALGLLWLVGQRYALQAFAGPGLLGFTIGVLLGTLYGVQSGWMLVGITAALVAWDLQHFVQHIHVSEQTETTPEDAEGRVDVEVRGDAEKRALERLHLQRLAIVSGLGLLLGTLALTVRLTLSFGVILALGLVAIYGLSRLIHYLRQESD
jgi:prepilin signal peptidase PulO-like enzyme (type II secretory pathway)